MIVAYIRLLAASKRPVRSYIARHTPDVYRPTCHATPCDANTRATGFAPQPHTVLPCMHMWQSGDAGILVTASKSYRRDACGKEQDWATTWAESSYA